MSWTCSGKTNEELIENLWRKQLLVTQRIKDAMLKVDRADFCPTMPYEDAPQRFGWDATISAPHIHANAAESLKAFLYPGAKVLDVGSGSGYLCALFAHLVTPAGKVIGVDHIPQITNFSLKNLRKSPVHSGMLDDGTIRIVTADGRKGYPEEGPYDAIHVGAAAAEMHQTLVNQLKSPGRMFIPVEGTDSQYIWQVDKDKDGVVTQKKMFAVLYVPLTERKSFDN